MHDLIAPKLKVSVVIKALNEEKKIAKAIKSSLDAVDTLGGEVILADSCSTDNTIEISRQFPIKIVQLANPAERCCGIGPQLGYQVSQGEYVYILDGDMEFLPGFMQQAVRYLDCHPEVAGVGGLIQEMNTESLEYLSRMARASNHMQPGAVDRLDMGGLYRRTAIEQTGYFSNRNLHSYEEYDLAVRLRSLEWQLHRINVFSIKHFGHDSPPYQLLFKRWQTGYIMGLGELLRASLFKAHFKLVIAEVRELKIYIITLIWLIVNLLLLTASLSNLKTLWILCLLVSMPFLGMAIKKRSMIKSVYSIVSWSMNALGLIRGLLKAQKKTNEQIKSITISTLPN